MRVLLVCASGRASTSVRASRVGVGLQLALFHLSPSHPPIPVNQLSPHRSIGDDDESSRTQGTTRLLLKGEIPAGRMPGLLPFTTVEYEEPLSDQLYDSAMLHGWLSCIDRLSTRRRERWCALDQNVLYEFEPQMGEMLLRAKHNLQGCVCYVPGDSADTFIVRTAGLFSTFGAKTAEIEISYTVDDASRRDMWIRAIALSSVMQLMEESKRVPHLIQQAVDARDEAAARKAKRRAQRQFERGSAAAGFSADLGTRASATTPGRHEGRSSAQTDSTTTTGTPSATNSSNPTGRGSVSASARQRAAAGSLAGSVRPLTAKERARMGAAVANGSSAASVAPSTARTVSVQGRAREGRSRAGGVRTSAAATNCEGSQVKVLDQAGLSGEGERESDIMSRESTDAASKEASDSLTCSTPSSSLVPSAAVSAGATDSDAESTSGANCSERALASRSGASQPGAAGAVTEGDDGANNARVPVVRRNVAVSSRTRVGQSPAPAPPAPVASFEARSGSMEGELESADLRGEGAGREDTPARAVIQVPLVAVRESLRKVEVAGQLGGGGKHAETSLAGQSCVDEAPLKPLLAGKVRVGGEGGRKRGADQNEGDANPVDGGGHETSAEPPPVPPRRR